MGANGLESEAGKVDKVGEDPKLLESVGFAELVEGMDGKGKEEINEGEGEVDRVKRIRIYNMFIRCLCNLNAKFTPLCTNITLIPHMREFCRY